MRRPPCLHFTWKPLTFRFVLHQVNQKAGLSWFGPTLIWVMFGSWKVRCLNWALGCLDQWYYAGSVLIRLESDLVWHVKIQAPSCWKSGYIYPVDKSTTRVRSTVYFSWPPDNPFVIICWQVGVKNERQHHPHSSWESTLFLHWRWHQALHPGQWCLAEL